MARAVLEGVPLASARFSTPCASRALRFRLFASSAAAARARFGRKFLADIFGLPVHPLALKGDANSWGAAMAAGVGVGLYTWSLAAERSRVERIVEPNPAAAGRYAELYGLFGESYRTGGHFCQTGAPLANECASDLQLGGCTIRS